MSNVQTLLPAATWQQLPLTCYGYVCCAGSHGPSNSDVVVAIQELQAGNKALKDQQEATLQLLKEKLGIRPPFHKVIVLSNRTATLFVPCFIQCWPTLVHTGIHWPQCLSDPGHIHCDCWKQDC